MSAAQGEELTAADAFTLAVAGELRVQMARKGVTGRELARRLHVSSQWVSQRTRGVVPMDTRDLASAAAALNVSIDELMREAIRRTSDPQATISYDYVPRTLSIVANPQVEGSAHAATTIAQMPSARPTEREDRSRKVA